MANTKHSGSLPNFALDPGRAVFGGAIDVNGRADIATITLAAPAGTDRDVDIQLQDALGGDVVKTQTITVHVFLDAGGLDWAVTGGTTGIVDNGAGAIVPLVAKKIFSARSTATGSLQLRWTDTGSEVAYLGLQLPSGRTVISDALTI